MSNFTLETSKREDLQEYLKNKKVEKKYFKNEWNMNCHYLSGTPAYSNRNSDLDFKSLNTEEAIEYLPEWINIQKVDWNYHISKHQIEQWDYEITHHNSNLSDGKSFKKDIYWKTLIEALENIYVFLLDNDLLK